MTFYDDAEFAAISLARLAAAEHDGDDGSRARQMAEVANDLLTRHGMAGITALVVALSRQYSSSLVALAGRRGISLGELLDQLEADKLDQIHGDSDKEA